MRRTGLFLALGLSLAAPSNPPPGAPGDRPRTSRPKAVADDLLPAVDAIADGAQAETQAEPHLAANPEDRRNLVGGWQEQRFDDGGARALGWATTTNGGRTWSSGIVPGLGYAAGGTRARATDPWIAFGPADRVYFSSMTFGGPSGSAINVNVSADGGRTWGDPVVVYETPDQLADKQAVAVDTHAASPWHGRVHVGWMNFRYDTAGRPVEQVILSSWSSDGGATWSAPRIHSVNTVNNGVVPAVGPDGTTYLVWLTQDTGQEYRQITFTRSTNGGRRWLRPRRIAELRSRPNGRDIRDGNLLVAFTAHPETGRLFVLWADRRFTGVDQLALLTSDDRGRTWSEPRRVSGGPDALYAFTPSLAIDDSGEVGISYFRGGAFTDGPYRTDLYFRGLGREGNAPGPEVRVTRQPFDIRDAAYANGWFLGDYAGLAGLRRGFRLLWVDTGVASLDRPGRGQPVVRSARVR